MDDSASPLLASAYGRLACVASVSERFCEKVGTFCYAGKQPKRSISQQTPQTSHTRKNVWYSGHLLVVLGELYYYMKKFLQFDWLRAVVFQLNLKYLHVKITNLSWVVV